MNVSEILQEIVEERKAQDGKWGTQRHAAVEWIPILGEEFGEVCRAALECHFGHGRSQWSDYRAELIQLAAVAVAMVESFDRTEMTAGFLFKKLKLKEDS